MNFFNLCEDPLLKLLKETFKANPILVPEERIQPLNILSYVNKTTTTYIGGIETLLISGHPLTLTQSSVMANLSVNQSKSIDTKLGLKVMDGFFKGLGANSASIEYAFKDTSKISFSFQNVRRKYIELGALAQILKTRKFDPENAVNKAFINEESRCLVITSVITSNNFTIKKETEGSHVSGFGIPEIQGILSSQNNNIQVSSASTLEITFQGKQQLAFAFTASFLEIDEDGSVYYDTDPNRAVLTVVPEDFNNEEYQPETFLIEKYGLIDINFE